jgi:hypothetical protein
MITGRNSRSGVSFYQQSNIIKQKTRAEAGKKKQVKAEGGKLQREKNGNSAEGGAGCVKTKGDDAKDLKSANVVSTERNQGKANKLCRLTRNKRSTRKKKPYQLSLKPTIACCCPAVDGYLLSRTRKAMVQMSATAALRQVLL